MKLEHSNTGRYRFTKCLHGLHMSIRLQQLTIVNFSGILHFKSNPLIE